MEEALLVLQQNRQLFDASAKVFAAGSQSPGGCSIPLLRVFYAEFQCVAYPAIATGCLPAGGADTGGVESSSQRLQRIRPVEQTPTVAPSGKEKREPGAIGQGMPLEPVSDQDKRKQARQAAEEKIAQAELAQLKQLSARDREVRAHEQAHKAVAGSYGGAIHYEYERGPDGNRYAVGGEVSIDTAPESSPEATLAKARVIQRAASARRTF